MGKKTKKTKLPKEVMGIRLSKEVREVGGALLDKANSPQGREMMVAGLTMAAAAATAAVAKGRAKRETAASPTPANAAMSPDTAERSTSPDAGAQGTQKQPDPQVIVDAVSKAAEAMLGRLFGAKSA